MGICTIDINDSGLRLLQKGQTLARSPGYANLAQEVVLGLPAEQRACLEPLQTTSHFWQQMVQDRLPQPVNTDKTPADLVWLHLLELWSQAAVSADGVVFATPSSFNRQQLELLLGIAEQCPFRTLAVVDAAIAAAAWLSQVEKTPQTKAFFYLDIHLHQTLLTEIYIENATWVRDKTISFATGVAALNDTLIKLIAEQFIQETRFDPLHQGQTEQSLYNHLPALLATLENKTDVLVRLDAVQHQPSLHLTAGKVQERLARAFKNTTDELNHLLGDGVLLLVSHRLLPYHGLLSALSDSIRLKPLPEHAIALGIDSIADMVLAHGDGVPMVMHLPITKDRKPAAAEQPAKAPAAETRETEIDTGFLPPATHLLIQNQAFSLAGKAAIYLSAQGITLSASDTKIARLTAQEDAFLLSEAASDLQINGNADTPSARALRAGDLLAVGIQSARCIQIIE